MCEADFNEVFDYMQFFKGHLLINETVDLYNEKLEHLEARPDDFIVAAFPKSGTTWTQEIVHLIQHDLDKDATEGRILEERFPCIDFKFPGVVDVDIDEWPKDQQRFVKCHLPYDLLPQDFKDKKCKIIYVTRNPKDTSISFYYFMRMLNYNPFRDFPLDMVIQKFLYGLVPYGPYWEHNLGYWKAAKEHPDYVMVVKYEDMIKRPHEEVRKIAKFLGKEISEEDVREVVYRTSFDKMKDNPKANYSWLDEAGVRDDNEAQFMRKGKIGDWKNSYSEELSKVADMLYEQNFGGTGLQHEFE